MEFVTEGRKVEVEEPEEFEDDETGHKGHTISADVTRYVTMTGSAECRMVDDTLYVASYYDEEEIGDNETDVEFFCHTCDRQLTGDEWTDWEWE